MNRKTWRRFLRIHLSTAMVLMIVAGVLLWLNVRTYSYVYTNLVVGIGWPFTFHGTFIILDSEESAIANGSLPHYWHIPSLAGNCLVALAILTVLALACEWRVRRAQPSRL